MRDRRHSEQCVPLIACAALAWVFLAHAAPGAEPTGQELQEKMDRTWEVLVKEFYSSKTGLFYTSRLNEVPGVEKFQNREPNLHGGGTGAEDCSMFGGILLAAMCDRFEVTRDPQTAKKAEMVFAGLRNAATVHGQPGFIARGVCEQDGKSIYPGSSRDQFTHSIHGMWRFYHSPLSSDADKQAIRDILCAVADKMTREVTFENGYSFKFAYGLDDDRGVARMRNVRTHEAARLPMFYAAAWTWPVSRNIIAITASICPWRFISHWTSPRRRKRN